MSTGIIVLTFGILTFVDLRNHPPGKLSEKSCSAPNIPRLQVIQKNLDLIAWKHRWWCLYSREVTVGRKNNSMVGGMRWSRFGKLLHINLLKNLSITGDWEYGRRRVQIWFDKSTEEEGRGQWHQWFPFVWHWKVPLERWFACLRWRTTEAHNDLLAGCRNQVIPLKMHYKSYSGTNWKLLMRWIFAGRQIIYWFRMSIFWRRPKILGALWFNVNWGFFPPSQTGGLKRESLKKIEILRKEFIEAVLGEKSADGGGGRISQ